MRILGTRLDTTQRLSTNELDVVGQIRLDVCSGDLQHMFGGIRRRESECLDTAHRSLDWAAGLNRWSLAAPLYET